MLIKEKDIKYEIWDSYPVWQWGWSKMFYLIWRHWRTLKMDRQTHCFILYFTLLYFVLLDFILLNFTLLYFTLLYLTLLYFTLFYFTLLDLTLLYLTLLYFTWLDFTLLDFTLLDLTLLNISLTFHFTVWADRNYFSEKKPNSN